LVEEEFASLWNTNVIQEAAQCSSSSYMKHHNSIPHQIAQSSRRNWVCYSLEVHSVQWDDWSASNPATHSLQCSTIH